MGKLQPCNAIIMANRLPVSQSMLDAIMAERARIEGQQQAALQQRTAQMQQLQQMMQGAAGAVAPQREEYTPEQLQFGEYQYKAKMAPKVQEYFNKSSTLNNVLTMDPKMSEWVSNSLKSLEKQYAPNLKPFEESAEFKAAEAALNDADFKKRSTFVDLLNKTITSVERAPQKEQASLAKTFLTSLINSAKGTSDAEQGNEFVRRSLELLDLPEYAQQTGKSMLNPTTVAAFLSTKQGETFAKKFNANPEAYLKKAREIHDDSAETWNKFAYERIVKPTSPEYADKFGVVPKVTFREQQQAQAPAPIFGEARPVGAPASVPVSSGVQTMTAPASMPVQSGTQTMIPQAQQPERRGSTIFRVLNPTR